MRTVDLGARVVRDGIGRARFKTHDRGETTGMGRLCFSHIGAGGKHQGRDERWAMWDGRWSQERERGTGQGQDRDRTGTGQGHDSQLGEARFARRERVTDRAQKVSHSTRC
jgi:hypothetical protein